MKNDLAPALVGLDALKGLDAAMMALFAEKGAVRQYSRDSIVIRQGDVIDNFYVVLGGRLVASHDGNIVNHFERGDTFAALSLMAEIPSLVDIKVRHDANIFSVPRDLFRAALASSTEFASNIFKGSAARLATIKVQSRHRMPNIVAVYSSPAGVGKTRFAVSLAAAVVTETAGRVLLLDVATEKKKFIDFLGFGATLPLVDLKGIEAAGRDVAAEKGRRHEAGFEILRVAHHPDRPGDEDGVAPLLSSLSQKFSFIVIDLPPLMDRAIWKFLAHADTSIVLSSPEPMHLNQTANLLGKLEGRVRILVTRATQEVHEKRSEIESVIGRPVDDFLDELPQSETIPYVENKQSPYSKAVRRMARTLLGTLWGLALSGGAARGMSHIGVLRVFEEEGLVPDVIAGTSIGALIGGLWAAGKNSAVLDRIARKIKRSEFFSIFDLALPPSPGLLRGTKIDGFIKGVFGKTRFSDLAIALRVVATDIDTADQVVFDRGLVADAVRASVAIPGILKPHTIDGRRLMDGAVVSPVPVSTLQKLGITRIIAVNAIPTAECFQSFNKSLVRKTARKSDFFSRLFNFTPEAIPNLLDIIVRSNQFMEASIAEESCRAASVIIRPWLPELHWMDFDSAPRFIAAGAKAARESMPEIKNILDQR